MLLGSGTPELALLALVVLEVLVVLVVLVVLLVLVALVALVVAKPAVVKGVENSWVLLSVPTTATKVPAGNVALNNSLT